jgi:hypothetical protein
MSTTPQPPPPPSSPAPTPYIPHVAGDLITAEDWDDVQVQIKEDIGQRITNAINNIKTVDHANDADTLQKKSLDQIEEEVLKRVLAEIPKEHGYQMLFKRLFWDVGNTSGDENPVNHKLGSCPLVDLYQLDYFQVVCAEDEEDRNLEWVNFYLYHTSEKKMRFANLNNGKPIEIESTDPKVRPYKIPFPDMLNRYHVEFTDDSGLGDLVTDFWTKFFSAPNDSFDQDQYCHSPWFERCCGERTTVKQLKSRGDWDDIWFTMRPKKTVNHLLTNGGISEPAKDARACEFPHNVQVAHLDFDTLVLKLTAEPVYPPNLVDQIEKEELKLMVLLKV